MGSETASKAKGRTKIAPRIDARTRVILDAEAASQARHLDRVVAETSERWRGALRHLRAAGFEDAELRELIAGVWLEPLAAWPSDDTVVDVCSRSDLLDVVTTSLSAYAVVVVALELRAGNPAAARAIGWAE